MLLVYTLEQWKQWDDIVRSFDEFDVYYLSGYVKAFRIHGDGEPLLFYYENDTCRGINVVMKRDIALDKHFQGSLKEKAFFDFSTPYGYGGWIIEGDDSSSLFEEYNRWCLDHGIVSEFVRFHPVLNNHRNSSAFYGVIPLGETVAVDISDKQRIWDNLTSKNRNVIRKAINSGIVIKNDSFETTYQTFIKIYNSTMDKDHADPYYYFDSGFYHSIQNDLKDNSTVFYAELNGQTIASSIMIYANGKMNYHLSGSLREYQHLAPSNLLLWKAAEWGNDQGFKTFHLGGGVGSAEDGLLRFKKAFYRGELCRYHIGKSIFNRKVYHELLASRNFNEKQAFFPEYRA